MHALQSDTWIVDLVFQSMSLCSLSQKAGSILDVPSPVLATHVMTGERKSQIIPLNVTSVHGTKTHAECDNIGVIYVIK